MKPEFEAWPKIPRKGKGTYVVSEKIDGTNAHIAITGCEIYAASRNRYITTEDDNYGFAKWVEENKDELMKLGEGRHYGEWAGLGIQKNPHNLPSKQFFLFNTLRWGSHNPNTPECCEVVPVIMEGSEIDVIDLSMKELLKNGSLIGDAGEPEGVVCYNTATKQLMKATFKSPNGKWEDK